MSGASTALASPTDAELVKALARLRGAEVGSIRLRERVPNRYASSAASESVEIEHAGQIVRVFCKHGTDYSHDVAGRRGVGYEAQVYQRLLVYGASVPRCHGSFHGAWGNTLVLEVLSEPTRLSHMPDGSGSAVVRAARLLGEWHRRAIGLPTGSWLNDYGAAHLSRWAAQTRASESTARLVSDPSLDRVVELLGAGEPTVVHGELMPSNVLESDGNIHFVDWESAGVGTGEIDLAALTLGQWSDATRSECEQAYATARWPSGAPPEFGPRMTAARVYALLFVARHEGRRGKPLDERHPLWKVVQTADRQLEGRS